MSQDNDIKFVHLADGRILPIPPPPKCGIKPLEEVYDYMRKLQSTYTPASSGGSASTTLAPLTRSTAPSRSTLAEVNAAKGNNNTELRRDVTSVPESPGEFDSWASEDRIVGDTLLTERRHNPHKQVKFLDMNDLPEKDPITSLYCHSYDEAVLKIVPMYWKPPMGHVPTPNSEEEMKPHVIRLKNAILNIKGNFDNHESRIYKLHWNPGSDLKVNEIMVERIAWEVVKTTVKLHEDGFRAPNFDKDLIQIVDTGLTFIQRINKLVQLFGRWKSVCDTAMKGEKIVAYVAGPAAYFKRSNANMKNNSKRKNAINKGKRAIATLHAQTPGSSSSFLPDDTSPTIPSPEHDTASEDIDSFEGTSSAFNNNDR